MSPFRVKKHKLLIQRQSDNTIVIDKFFLFFFNWTSLLTFISFLLNYLHYHYRGLNFIQAQFMFTLISYSSLNLYICHLIPQLHRFKGFFTDFLLLALMFLSMQALTVGIQFTPFAPIDHLIYQIEPLPLTKIIAWTHLFPKLTDGLEKIYQSLTIGLFNLPFLMLFLSPREKIHEWIKFLLVSACLGFTFYYVFPSCGPASIFQDLSIFKQYQLDNFIKFQQIHQGLTPSTANGGLIALPSYHVIWAWAITRCFQNTYLPLFALAWLWFIGICCSCVMLGWHYSVDIIASFGIIVITEKLLKKASSS